MFEMTPRAAALSTTFFLSLGAITLSACGSDTTGVAGCTSNDQCRGDRVCVAGACTNPEDVPLTEGDMSTMDQGGPQDMTPIDPPDMPVDPPDVPIDPPDVPAPDMDEDMPIDPPDMPVDPPVLGPQIELTPAEVNFGLTTVGSMTTSSLVVTNVGDAPLTLSSLDLRDRPSQAFDVSPVVTPASPATIAAGDSVTYTLSYVPQQGGQFQNFIDVTSDDIDDPEVEVELSGRAIEALDRPCVYSSPDVLDYGLVTPGGSRELSITLGNCSQNDVVTVETIELEDPGFPFIINAPATPFVLNVGQSVNVPVKFEPTTADDFETELVINDNSQNSPRSFVELFGTSGACTEAVIVGENSFDQVLPDIVRPTTLAALSGMETVSLDGSDSVTTSGQAVYTWAVRERPMGSTARLAMFSAPTTTFAPDLPGRYVIELDVVDALTGQGSCEKATIELIAFDITPVVAASISWTAPHDVDLHFLRDDGMGNFPSLTDADNDLYYDNPTLDWGMMGATSDDGVFLGDSRSAGEEGVLLGNLEGGRSYRVVAQYTRPGGRRPFEFDVTATVTVTYPASGRVDTQTATETFRIIQVNREWVAFEIDGKSGQISLPANP